MSTRIDKVVTSGIFSIDGEDFEVDNNIWLIGDDHEVVVVDAAHDAGPIVEAVGDRTVVAIVCTHGHNDHINAAVDLAERTNATIHLHPDDQMLWDDVHPGRGPDAALVEGDVLDAGGASLRVLHTPGHSPGGICLVLERDGEPDHVFGGDTLFKGGPGATGRSFSNFDTIITSIEAKLLTMSGDTVVHPGHGDDTLIVDEAPHLAEWVARGH